MTTGTYDISSLLSVRHQVVPEFGMDKVQTVLEADVAAHNQLTLDMVSNLAEPTTDLLRRYGESIDGEMVEVDEYGRSNTQRAAPGSTVGFPLRLFQFAIGWTRKWLETHTPADMATATQNAEKAHLRRVQREIRRALYLSSNFTFTDFLVDKVDLPVKRLLNADGMAIPNGPNGETFDAATHTHYLARAGGSLAASDVTGTINHVVEHGHGGAVKIAINKADETTWRALTGFVAYPDPRLIYRATDTPGQTLDISRLDNRAIGIIGAAELWVKPWAITNYAAVWDANAPEKPLAFRQRTATSLQGLRIAGEITTFPLQAQYMEAEFGFGVWNRSAAAILYYGDTTYADPTIS
jgi:hypothetical protein